MANQEPANDTLMSEFKDVEEQRPNPGSSSPPNLSTPVNGSTGPPSHLAAPVSLLHAFVNTSVQPELPGKGKGKRNVSETFDDIGTEGMNYDPSFPPIIKSIATNDNSILGRPQWDPMLGLARSQAAAGPTNIYEKLIRHVTLFYDFIQRLHIDTFVDLYAIDKTFHFRVNKYAGSLLVEYAKYQAYDAAYVFSHHNYPLLCVTDPNLKPMDGRAHLAREIPSLKWCRMVIERDQVVREILTFMAVEGHRFPKDMVRVLMMFWVLMELGNIDLRRGFLADSDTWTDANLILLNMFLVKLDMRFSHASALGPCGLSHLLMSQRSLLPLRDTFDAQECTDYESTIPMIIRTYRTEDLDTDLHPELADETEFNVPAHEMGILAREDFDDEGAPMASPVDMLRDECANRDLKVQQWLIDFVTYGYVDDRTGKNIPMVRTLLLGTEENDYESDEDAELDDAGSEDTMDSDNAAGESSDHDDSDTQPDYDGWIGEDHTLYTTSSGAPRFSRFGPRQIVVDSEPFLLESEREALTAHFDTKWNPKDLIWSDAEKEGEQDGTGK